MTRPASRALTRLYDENVDHVYGYLGYSIMDRDGAEKLTQSTFERAFSTWDRFDARQGSARVWLLALARDSAAGQAGDHSPQDDETCGAASAAWCGS